ncbi:hypothetical protein SBA4_2600005 [Candidatus Sulfopaludibacter sp. SbA4]|nr:hypothetical protein SBA4_2600005 [Candidatus Sulfopaludibacter sp. SbA4]
MLECALDPAPAGPVAQCTFWYLQSFRRGMQTQDAVVTCLEIHITLLRKSLYSCQTGMT